MNNSKLKKEKVIQLSPNIGSNDLERKKKDTLKFLSKGHPVKVRLFLSGREKDIISHQECQDKLESWFPKEEWSKYIKSSSSKTKSRNYFLFMKPIKEVLIHE